MYTRHMMTFSNEKKPNRTSSLSSPPLQNTQYLHLSYIHAYQKPNWGDSHTTQKTEKKAPARLLHAAWALPLRIVFIPHQACFCMGLASLAEILNLLRFVPCPRVFGDWDWHLLEVWGLVYTCPHAMEDVGGACWALVVDVVVVFLVVTASCAVDVCV